VSVLLWLPNLNMAAGPVSAPVVIQQFEQALVARLLAIPELTAYIGTAIYKTFVPQTHDYGANGPALTYTIPTKPRGHVLGGGDGTATARVQIDAWGYGESTTKLIIQAIGNGIDTAGWSNIWGNGSVIIITCIQQDDTDLDEEPKAGTDQVLYHTVTEFSVKFRIPIPTLS
jgi:hypothetical protein